MLDFVRRREWGHIDRNVVQIGERRILRGMPEQRAKSQAPPLKWSVTQ